MRWICPLLSLLGLLGVANGACTGAEWLGGRLHAYCTDELTSDDFEYIDMDGRFPQPPSRPHSRDTVFPASESINSEVYALYENASGSNATATLDKRAFKNLWNWCSQHVSGGCSQSNVIGWGGVSAAWVANVIAIVTEATSGKRETGTPRSICTNYAASNSNFCISWAAYRLQDMTQDQIKAIANGCWENCQAINKSCTVSCNRALYLPLFQANAYPFNRLMSIRTMSATISASATGPMDALVTAISINVDEFVKSIDGVACVRMTKDLINSYVLED